MCCSQEIHSYIWTRIRIRFLSMFCRIRKLKPRGRQLMNCRGPSTRSRCIPQIKTWTTSSKQHQGSRGQSVTWMASSRHYIIAAVKTGNSVNTRPTCVIYWTMSTLAQRNFVHACWSAWNRIMTVNTRTLVKLFLPLFPFVRVRCCPQILHRLIW